MILEINRTILVIPAFSLPATFPGVSELLTQFSIGNTDEFSLKIPITSEASYVLAVRWTSSTNTYRYRLWNSGVLYFPVYAGSRIGLNAYFEVWSVSGSALAVSAGRQLEASWLNYPDAGLETSDVINCSEVPLVAIPPNPHTNPFNVNYWV